MLEREFRHDNVTNMCLKITFGVILLNPPLHTSLTPSWEAILAKIRKKTLHRLE